jgi:hypothetical protein
VTPFRIKLPALWRQASAGLLAGAVAGRASLWLQGEPFSWPGTVPMMLATALVTVAAYLLQPTLAGPAGLKLLNNWGLRRTLAWDDVRSADLARMYGLQPSFRLRDARGRAHRIARDTEDLAGLHAIALRHGGPGHPLVQVLSTPLYAA